MRRASGQVAAVVKFAALFIVQTIFTTPAQENKLGTRKLHQFIDRVATWGNHLISILFYVT
jgi:hypothetical protein